MFAASLCLARLDAGSAEVALRALARALERNGHVKPTFEAAAIARERKSPTGLPFPGRAVALPHADPEHVLSPAIAIASLRTPVKFREMGSPGTSLDVSLVVMPAFSAKEHAAASLARLVELLQDAAVRDELAAAETGEALVAALARRWAPE